MSRVATCRVRGDALTPGMGFVDSHGVPNAVIIAMRPYRIPASILIDSVARANPDGIAGFIAETNPVRYSMTIFPAETYDVVVPEVVS